MDGCTIKNKCDYCRLAGMKHAPGKSAEYWQQLTGIDPRTVAGVEIRNGACYWTMEAERVYLSHSANVRANYAALGVPTQPVMTGLEETYSTSGLPLFDTKETTQ